MASPALFQHPQFDEEYGDGEAFAAQAGRHIQELPRLSAFQQVTTKVPPAYDGRSSWFAYEDAIDDWVDITELEPEKQGPALRNRLEVRSSNPQATSRSRETEGQGQWCAVLQELLAPFVCQGCFERLLVPLPAVHDLAPWQWRHAAVDYQIPTLGCRKLGMTPMRRSQMSTIQKFEHMLAPLRKSNRTPLLPNKLSQQQMRG